MTKLIINADDFGLSKGTNYGIIEAHKNGVVRSTSIMAAMPGFDHAVELLKECPDLGCGVHMTLTAYKPLLKTHKTIVDENGYFYKGLRPNMKIEDLDLDEVYNEFCAQIEKVKNAGIEITHLDSHHHIHTAPFLKTVMERILEKYKLPVRGGFLYDFKYGKIVQCAHFFYEDTVSVETFTLNEERFKEYDVVDTMCHPAYLDSFIMGTSSYNIKRIEELEVLTSSKLKKFFQESEVKVCNYRELD